MEDPKDWKFKRNRNGDEHINNCSDGYYRVRTMGSGKSARFVAEIHHILCVHACSDATFPGSITKEEIDFIHKSLAITDWNINGTDNNIGLPRKWAYVLDTSGATGWDCLPCHQVDHDIYLYKVEEWVTENVWNKIKANKKDEKCENMDPESVKKLFDTGSKRWKALLKARGVKHGGTKACLDYCLKGEEDASKESVWHIPFSMAFPESDVRRRSKPPKGISVARAGLLTMIK